MRRISGTITDEIGQPIIGATVAVKGTVIGTITNIDGQFQLEVEDPAVLIVSYIGYATQEIPVSGQSVVDIIMKEDDQQLSELVVIGYGAMKKSDLTGSITTIGEKDFRKGLVSNLSSLITGKAAGVQIVSNGGRAGDGNTIRIRGGASLNASNDPLIVIDGLPLSNEKINGLANPFSSLNPNDIESINILKDASATAIYGSRASNGVIIITTKQGTVGQVKVDVSSQNSIATIARRIHVLSADEFRNLVTHNPYADQRFTDLLGNASTDWQNEIFRSAFTTDNTISIGGAAGAHLPYRLSAGLLSQNGILDTDHVQRATVALNLSPVLWDNHLTINLNLKGTHTRSRFGNSDAIGAALRMDPTKPVKADGFDDLNGYWAWLQASGDLNTLATTNPVAMLHGKDDRSNILRSMGNARFDYKIHFLPDLRANLNLGYDLSKGSGQVITQPWSPTFYTKAQASGERTRFKQNNRNLLLEFYLAYSKQLNEAHRIDLMAGYTYQDWMITDHNYPIYYFDGTTVKSTPTFETNKPQHTLISCYGRLNYSLLSRYLLTATLRRDGSSRFSANNRWGTFPSLAFAWRINEENFLRNISALSNLKIRLGWGTTGQQDGLGDYEYMAKYSYSENTARIQFGDTYYNMYRPDGYDANRRWETTTTSNIGLDWGLLNNRIYGDIDLYNKKTKDLLNLTPLAMGGNFTNLIIQNIGTMNNKGIEASLHLVPIDNKQWHWDLGFNLTHNQSKITQLTLNDQDPEYVGAVTGDAVSGGTGNYVLMNSVGHTPRMFYVYKQLYTPDGKPIDGGYADLNRDGLINEKDKYHFHSAMPDYYIGFSTTLDYKRWTAATSLRANIGNYIFDNTNFDMGTLAQTLNPNNFLMNALPNLKQTNFYLKQNLSDYFVQNASFLKIDYLQLAYDFGPIAKNIRLQANATVQNIYTLTKYKGIDPEIQSGVDNNFYPNPRTFTIGLNLNF
jgi:iron complex outermembrane receptor protein